MNYDYEPFQVVNGNGS